MVLKTLQPWRDLWTELANKPIGTTKVYLQQKECAYGECNLGNFYTDAMLNAFLQNESYNRSNWSNVSIALTTQGNFRVPLNKGVITYNHLITMCPWGNKLYALTLKGKVIRDVLEESVASMNNTQIEPRSSRFLQVSKPSKPIGQRIVELKVRCTMCNIPNYFPLNVNEEYRIAVMEYLANGKNGFHLISDNAKDVVEGPEDVKTLIAYIEQNEPITVGVEGRINILL